MYRLSTDEWAIRRELVLIATAPYKQTIQYGHLANRVRSILSNPNYCVKPYRPLFPMLGHVSVYEIQHGRPPLSALVVRAEDGKPGPGYDILLSEYPQYADWDLVVQQIFRVWDLKDPSSLLDCHFDAVRTLIAGGKPMATPDLPAREYAVGPVEP